jgi:hypothetical protein
MRFSSAIILSAAFVLSAHPGLGQAQEPKAFLAVGKVSVDPAAGSVVHVSLKNIGSKTITAYAVLTSRAAKPTTEDFFDSIGVAEKFNLPKAQSSLGGIRPGEEHDLAISTPGGTAPTIEVTAVVFSDRTAVGDSAQVADIFSFRAGRAAELERWCGTLTPDSVRLLGAQEMRAAVAAQIRAARAANVSETDPVRDGGAQLERQGIIATLQQAVDNGTILGRLSLLQARCAVATEHSRRVQ